MTVLMIKKNRGWTNTGMDILQQSLETLSENENEESCQELASTRYWNENVFFNVFIIQKRERKSTESEKA